MKQKSLTNQELAKIERSLFKSVQSNKAELDEIIESPKLLSSIKLQINQEKLSQSELSTPFKFNFRVVGYALMSSLTIVCLLIFAYYFVNTSSNMSMEAISIPDEEKQNLPIETASQQFIAVKPNNFAKIKTPKVTKTSERVVKIKPESVPVKSTQAKKVLPKPNKILTENASPFYVLNSRENPPSENQGMSIIRGDFSRAELLALGVDVLNDIGDSKVKSEILVGDDGQPRAIRFIK